MSEPLVPKPVRFQEFLERLRKAPSAETGDEAKRLIDETLNKVEDDLTDIPFNPDHWRTDGRMYPVQEDNASDVDGQEVVLEKPGADGKGVWS